MNQKLNNFLKDPRTNWKFIWIVVIAGFIAGTVILGYYAWWLKDLETQIAELREVLSLPAPPLKIED